MHLIELKFQLSKDCRRTGTYAHLRNVEHDFASRIDLSIPHLGVVLFTHVLGSPPARFRRVIRFWAAFQAEGTGRCDERLDLFRTQLHGDFPEYRIAPGRRSAMCRVDAGKALGTKVELVCWVLEPKTRKPAVQV